MECSGDFREILISAILDVKMDECISCFSDGCGDFYELFVDINYFYEENL
jgi:hypothetical protein